MLHRSLQRFTDPNAALALQQEATRMVKVLQELDFIDRSGAPLPKGTMACHLFVPEDALLVADVIIALKGFEKFTAPQAFAICAAFVTEGPYSDRTKISDKVVRVGLQICRRVARKLASKLHFHQLPCCKTCGLNASGCDGEAMIKARLNPQLCETAFQWASGQDFTAAVLSSRVATGAKVWWRGRFGDLMSWCVKSPSCFDMIWHPGGGASHPESSWWLEVMFDVSICFLGCNPAQIY